MKKTNRPPFDELIERMYAAIDFRHPDKKMTHLQKDNLRIAWSGKDDQLYRQVVEMERNNHKAVSIKDKFEDRTVTFQIGVDVLGNPTYCEHNVRFKKDFTKPSRFSKKGSTTTFSSNYLFFGRIFKQW